MNGIKMSDCKFYVDENARTVVCVIPNRIKTSDGTYMDTSDMVLNFIQDNFSFNDINMYDSINFWDGKISKHLRMPHTFIGKAVCSSEDEWNEETGRMIAFARAKDKCYKSFFKRANMFVQSIDRRLGDMIEQFNNFGMKLEDRRENLQQKIDEHLGIVKDE